MEWADLASLDLSLFDVPGGKQKLANQLKDAVHRIGETNSPQTRTYLTRERLLLHNQLRPIPRRNRPPIRYRPSTTQPTLLHKTNPQSQPLSRNLQRLPAPRQHRDSPRPPRQRRSLQHLQIHPAVRALTPRDHTRPPSLHRALPPPHPREHRLQAPPSDRHYPRTTRGLPPSRPQLRREQ